MKNDLYIAEIIFFAPKKIEQGVIRVSANANADADADANANASKTTWRPPLKGVVIIISWNCATINNYSSIIQMQVCQIGLPICQIKNQEGA